ncbi:MAG: hypothetical protein ABEH35_08480 [Haloarculaceae archaeon]
MAGTYHLVCHDCQEEGMYDDHTDAVDARTEHERETSHRMTVQDITRSVPTS